MIKENFEIDGKIYRLAKIFAFKKKKYIEYRSEDAEKIRFYEIKNSELLSVSNKKDFVEAIRLNYIIEE